MKIAAAYFAGVMSAMLFAMAALEFVPVTWLWGEIS